MRWKKLTAVIILIVAIATESAADDYKVWRSNELGVRFTYPSHWVVSDPVQQATRFVVSWLAAKSGGLLITCYMQEYTSNFGLRSKERIHFDNGSLRDEYLSNLRKRDSDAVILKFEKTYQDNWPIWYLEAKSSVKNLTRTSNLSTKSILTSWRGKEILFTCGAESWLLEEGSGARSKINADMLRVLGSLQFDR